MHATRPKGTVRNGKFKLSLTPAFQVNIMKHHRYMFASIKERSLDSLIATKWADHIPVACFSKVTRIFRARKASFQTAILFFGKSYLLINLFLNKKNQEEFEVWWLRTSALQRYKGNCCTRNRPVEVSGLGRTTFTGWFQSTGPLQIAAAGKKVT